MYSKLKLVNTISATHMHMYIVLMHVRLVLVLLWDLTSCWRHVILWDSTHTLVLSISFPTSVSSYHMIACFTVSQPAVKVVSVCLVCRHSSFISCICMCFGLWCIQVREHVNDRRSNVTHNWHGMRKELSLVKNTDCQMILVSTSWSGPHYCQNEKLFRWQRGTTSSWVELTSLWLSWERSELVSTSRWPERCSPVLHHQLQLMWKG